MKELQKYDIAERQAGPGASEDEIRKFYLHPSLADSVGKYCSLSVFEFLSEKSKECLEFIGVEPKMSDFSLAPSHFQELSELETRAGIILKVIGGLFGVGAILKRSPDLERCIAYARALRAHERSRLSFWRTLSWREFEIEVARLFRRMGFRSNPTPATGDSGVDVTLSDEMGRNILVQCKHHARPIGPAIVRENGWYDRPGKGFFWHYCRSLRIYPRCIRYSWTFCDVIGGGRFDKSKQAELGFESWGDGFVTAEFRPQRRFM